VASGQLARHIGLPWRSSGSSASPVEDAQGAWETVFNLQGAMRGGANVILHSAGWQEGGLVASYEKFILDVEVLETIAESWTPIDTSPDELAFDVIAGVRPGQHFFGEAHTLARFATAFREPIVATRKTFEQWTEEGRLDARSRAAGVWRRVLATVEPPAIDDAIRAEVDEFVERRKAEGGAPVE
jgi:trimethylamine--corrinoid protein Co-methyltransferase